MNADAVGIGSRNGDNEHGAVSVDILVPVLRRPHRVKPLLDSIAKATPERHVTTLVLSAADTATRDAIIEARTAGYDPDLLVVPGTGGQPGDYAAKIHAALAVTDGDWVFTGADDLAFHAGWLTAALTCARESGADVIGTNDLYNPRVLAGNHSTHSLVRRAYITDPGAAWGEPGHLFCEQYGHEFLDDELVGVAKSRGTFAACLESVVEHLHPYAGKAPRDAVYDLGHRLNAQGAALYDQRRRLWHGPPLRHMATRPPGQRVGRSTAR